MRCGPVNGTPRQAPAMAGPTTGLGFEFSAMSSVCEIRLDGGDEPGMAEAARAAIAEVHRIEQKFSRYRDDSIVSRINAAAGCAAPVEVDTETAALLDFAAQLHGLSDGLFDITSGVLRKAWNFRTGQLPAARELELLLPLIGWAQVQWQGGGIRLPHAGMELDFGGFGKEYAADRAAGVLQAAGQTHGFVNLGGDIRVIGPRADGGAWRFGIAHPRATASKAASQTTSAATTIASVAMTEGALASSGDYERFFERDGRRFCHILDPHSGWPVEAWASVSVVAFACASAGALSTIAMLKGPQALDFLNTQQASFLAIDTALRTFSSGREADRRFDFGEH